MRVVGMLIPVRCWSCNLPIAHLYSSYVRQTSRGEAPEATFVALGLDRICCRRMFLSQPVGLVHDIAAIPDNRDSRTLDDNMAVKGHSSQPREYVL